MLYQRDDGPYRRIALLEFRDERDLKTGFEGCDIRKIIIY